MNTGYEDALRIASRRHDIIGVHLYDPKDQEIPNVGLIRAIDAETGKIGWIDTGMSSVREKYANIFKENYNYFRSTVLKSGADSVSIRTDESYVNALLRFFKKRK